MKWLPRVVVLITMAAGSSSLEIRCDFNAECRDFGLTSCCNNTCNARQYCSKYCDSRIDCLPTEICLNSLCTLGRLLHRLRRSPRRTSSSTRCQTQKDCPRGKRCNEYRQECFSCYCEDHEDCINGKCVKVREVGQISTEAIVDTIIVAIIVIAGVVGCSYCFCPCCCCRQQPRQVLSLPLNRPNVFLRHGEGIHNNAPESHGIPVETSDCALAPTLLTETVGNTEYHLPPPPTYEEATKVI